MSILTNIQIYSEDCNDAEVILSSWKRDVIYLTRVTFRFIMLKFLPKAINYTLVINLDYYKGDLL